MIVKMQITPFKKSGRCLEGIDFSKYQRIISHSPLIEYICYASITYTPQARSLIAEPRFVKNRRGNN